MSIQIYNNRRSVTSYLLEKYIGTLDTKKNLSTRENTLNHLKHMDVENTKPYELGKVKLISSVTERSFEDMQVFTLNDQISADQKVILYIHHNTFVYPKMNHVFVLYPIPEAKDAERKIIDIIKH
ncbi:hypothetical protein JNUCC31_18995 [Paenibacillus sp. JNUCC31]|uniref:hypothetical protein n=1 Tax=Paenibacillus sp. JNUCC-31 TaxID=2777983 RepID=UPI00178058E6|nr:hypothetical protein [Paenibacillus sp. JNUCC-31]QOS76915.1 hypothetical protein JNUCC31_18995 [Paenibacillus sp. JNUCC-31]